MGMSVKLIVNPHPSILAFATGLFAEDTPPSLDITTLGQLGIEPAPSELNMGVLATRPSKRTISYIPVLI